MREKETSFVSTDVQISTTFSMTVVYFHLTFAIRLLSVDDYCTVEELV